MPQVAKVSYPTALFFALAVLFTFKPIGYLPHAFAWLGAIQLLNAVAPYLPSSLGLFIHWIHAITFECFALLGVAVLRFIPTPLKPAGTGRPVLLVHGYLNHGTVWIILKKQLEALGLGPIYTINLGYPFRSILTYAEQVKARAEAIAQETGRKDLILIGHSMGGLISSWYATQLALPDTVTDIVAIGSPWIGTPVARIGLGPNAKEMQPHSPLLNQLKTAVAQNKQIHFYHIATKTDELVIPGDSAILPNHARYIINDLGHASLLYSPRVSAQIGEWLRSPPAPSPR